MLKRSLLVILVSSLSLGLGCDYEIPLSDGYELVRMSGGGNIVLADQERIIVGPSVVGYRDLEHIIVGLVEKSPGHDEVYREGYFLVDKKVNKSHWSLSKEEWLEKLLEHGVEEEPQLRRPNRLHAWF